MVLKFEEQVDGIPLEISVKQTDGSNKVIPLFVATDENSLVELIDKSDATKNKAKKIIAKYPALSNDIDDDDMDQLKEAIKGATELMRENYDEMFGKGTYQELADAGLGLMKLIPLLSDLTDGLSEELEKVLNENKNKSDKRKAERLIKNKKKRK